MQNYMIDSLMNSLKKAKAQLEELKKSDRENKEEILKKYVELVDISDSLLTKLTKQIQLQKDVLGLSEKKKILEEEIESLLLK
jgi:uncharacterized protein with NRDE domain